MKDSETIIQKPIAEMNKKPIAKNKNSSENKNWERLVSSLKKGIEEANEERGKGKNFPTSVEVSCTQKDIANSIKGWKREKSK